MYGRFHKPAPQTGGVEIRYHSIIFELIDEVKTAMGGLLSPDTQEDFIGYAEIRQVFGVSKIGQVAGCGHRRRYHAWL